MIKDARIVGIEFRGLFIGTFKDYKEVEPKPERVIKEVRHKVLEVPTQPKPDDINFDAKYIQSIIGSYEDWQKFKAMVQGWAGIKPVSKLEAKAEASDHDTIMKMSAERNNI